MDSKEALVVEVVLATVRVGTSHKGQVRVGTYSFAVDLRQLACSEGSTQSFPNWLKRKLHL